MNAYTFPSQEAAAAALVLVEAEMRVIAAEKGFTVLPDGGVVGKNAATGQDSPGAVTYRWADVIQFDDGSWGFPSFRDTFQTTWPRIEAAAILSAPTTATITPQDTP